MRRAMREATSAPTCVDSPGKVGNPSVLGGLNYLAVWHAVSGLLESCKERLACVPRRRGDGQAAMTLLTRPAATTEATTPPFAADPNLLLWGQDLARQHQVQLVDCSKCSNPRCPAESGYPCLPRRIADRLIAASEAGWPHCWTARHDALSCGLSPSGDATGITQRPSPDRGCRD